MRVRAQPSRLVAGQCVSSVVVSAGPVGEAEAAFTLDAKWSSTVDTGAAPFIPALTVLAGKLGEDMHIDGSVPEELVRSARNASALLGQWWGWRVASVTAESYSDDATTGSGLGMCFSRGVDSWAVLLDRLQEPGLCPTHLLALDAEPVLPPETVEALLDGVDAIGAELQIPVVRVATNIRDVLEPMCDWPNETHGSVLAGAALLLRPLLGNTIISATQWAPIAQRCGSHPDLDSRWAAPGWGLVHADADRRRWQRVETVSRSPLALETLQVCYRTDRASNCGRCEKCLRTMTSLAATGGLARTNRFEQELTVEAVRALPPTQPFSVDDVIDHLDRFGVQHDELRQAWEEVPLDESCGQKATGHRIARRPLGLDGADYEVAARHLNLLLYEHRGVRIDHFDSTGATPIPLGWQNRSLGLAPTAEQIPHVRKRLELVGERPDMWCARASGEPGGLALIELAQRTMGRGVISTEWTLNEESDDQPVYWLWWRECGELDVVGVLQSLLAGCVPIQVMPDSAAQRTRLRLPAPWHHLVHERTRLAGLTRDHAFALSDELIAWLDEHDQETLLARWEDRVVPYA